MYICFSEFCPQICHHILIGSKFYDYYDRIRNPLVRNAYIAVALRKAMS